MYVSLTFFSDLINLGILLRARAHFSQFSICPIHSVGEVSSPRQAIYVGMIFFYTWPFGAPACELWFIYLVSLLYYTGSSLACIPSRMSTPILESTAAGLGNDLLHCGCLSLDRGHPGLAFASSSLRIILLLPKPGSMRD